MKLSRFNDFHLNENLDERETFYKIISDDQRDIDKWLNKEFIVGKNTIVTKDKRDSWLKTAEIQDNEAKTIVTLNVPKSCIIDNEGDWYVVDLASCRDQVDVSF